MLLEVFTVQYGVADVAELAGDGLTEAGGDHRDFGDLARHLVEVLLPVAE